MAKKEDGYEKFRNISAAVQSCVIALSVLAGGLWTFYLFKTLHTKEKAEKELKESKRINHQGVVTIDVKAEQEFISDDDTGRSIRINIQATNWGDSNTTLKLGDRPLVVARLHPDNKGLMYKKSVQTSYIPSFDHDKIASGDLTLNEPIEPVTIEILRAKQAVSFPTWLYVEEPGLYFIQFAAELTGDDLKVIQEISGQPKEIFHVTGQTYIIVK